MLTLGRVRDQAGRQLTQPFDQGAEEQVEGTDAAAAGRSLEALEPDPDKLGRHVGGQGVGDGTRGPDRVGVLLLAAVAVAVLEVEPQVLDRVGPQLGGDPLGHLRR